ncbi:hypothetical protein DFJ73DRAFT_893048 [Zopfochytrium polystomum]|nr:hypothetical protein DFJ73DRAFT_893048 [Zopfochytrium polystomum]
MTVPTPSDPAPTAATAAAAAAAMVLMTLLAQLPSPTPPPPRPPPTAAAAAAATRKTTDGGAMPSPPPTTQIANSAILILSLLMVLLLLLLLLLLLRCSAVTSPRPSTTSDGAAASAAAAGVTTSFNPNYRTRKQGSYQHNDSDSPSVTSTVAHSLRNSLVAKSATEPRLPSIGGSGRSNTFAALLDSSPSRRATDRSPSKRNMLLEAQRKLDKDSVSDPARPSILRVRIVQLAGGADNVDRIVKFKLRKRELVRKVVPRSSLAEVGPCEFVINYHTHSFDPLKVDLFTKNTRSSNHRGRLRISLSDMPDWHTGKYNKEYTFPEDPTCSVELAFEFFPIILASEDDDSVDGSDAASPSQHVDPYEIFMEMGALNKLSEGLEPKSSLRKSSTTHGSKSWDTASRSRSSFGDGSFDSSRSVRAPSLYSSSTHEAGSANDSPDQPAANKSTLAGSEPESPSRLKSFTRGLTGQSQRHASPTRASTLSIFGLRPRTSEDGNTPPKSLKTTPATDAAPAVAPIASTPTSPLAHHSQSVATRSSPSPEPAGETTTDQANPTDATVAGAAAADSAEASESQPDPAGAPGSPPLRVAFIPTQPTAKDGRRFSIVPHHLKASLGEVDVLLHAALKHGSNVKRGSRVKAFKLLQRWETALPMTRSGIVLAGPNAADPPGAVSDGEHDGEGAPKEAATVPAATTTATETLEVLDMAQRMCDHCLCTYGAAVIQFCGYGSFTDTFRPKSDRWATAHHLDIEMSDILLWGFGKNEVNKPRFIVAYDKKIEAIVISIQGTISLQQVITDLQAEYFPIKGGTAHVGMLRSAQWIITKHFADLKKWVAERRPARLLTTGHSLGAGTATLLTLLLVDKLEELRAVGRSDLVLHAYTMAPPLTVSQDLADTYGHLFSNSRIASGLVQRTVMVVPVSDGSTRSVIFNADIVPRLSYGTVVDFKKMLSEAAGLVGSGASDSECHEALSRLRRGLLESASADRRLVIPGAIYHLLPAEPPRLKRSEKRMADAVAAAAATAADGKAAGAAATPLASPTFPGSDGAPASVAAVTANGKPHADPDAPAAAAGTAEDGNHGEGDHVDVDGEDEDAEGDDDDDEDEDDEGDDDDGGDESASDAERTHGGRAAPPPAPTAVTAAIATAAPQAPQPPAQHRVPRHLKRKPARRMVVETASTELFLFMSVRRGFFMNHMPWEYDGALLDARRTARAGSVDGAAGGGGGSGGRQ